MDDLERYRLRQAAAWKRLRAMGTRNARCLCGETNPLCFEVEHVERRKGSDFVVALCKNCHAIKTSREATENPPLPAVMSNPLERAAHALLGIVFYLEACAERLRQVAELLFKLVAKGITLEE